MQVSAQDLPAAGEMPRGNEPVPTRETSRLVLEMRLRQVYTDEESLKTDVKEISNLLALIRNAEDGLAKVQPENDIKSPLQAVKEAFAKVKENYRPSETERLKQALISFGNSMATLETATKKNCSDAIEEVRRLVAPLRRSSFFDENPPPERPSRLPPAIKAAWTSAFKGDSDLLKNLPESQKLTRAARLLEYASMQVTNFPDGVAKVLSAQDAPALAGAEKEINTMLESSAAGLAQKNLAEHRAAIAATKSAASNELKQATTAIEAKAKEQAALDEQIRKREDAQQGRQDRVSKNLQPVFWGIMSAILFTIVALRVKSDAQSLLMVRDRTAVEMLSIGMFLMTILFLGTGEFLQKETLGTLLGTLAGYLFTRRASERRPGEDGRVSDQKPEKPRIDGTAA